MKDDEIWDVVMDSVDDLVKNFLYYDRKEDEILTASVLENAFEHHVVTVDDIVSRFEATLRSQRGETP